MVITKYKTNQYDSLTGALINTQDVCKNYSAIVNQVGSLDGTYLGAFGEGFIIGEYYTIDTYESGDDFSNIAEVIEGNINTSGCYFRATGLTPTNWHEGSYLYSDGSFVVNELENTLGVNIYWDYTPLNGEGYGYIYAEDKNTNEFVDLKDLGVPFATLQTTYPQICCSPMPSFTVQYSNWFGGMVFLTWGTYVNNNNFYTYDNMLWDSAFQLKIFPNGGTQNNPQMLSRKKTQLKISSPTPRTPKVPFSGITETPTQSLIKNAMSSMTKEEFHDLLKSRR